MHNNFFYFIYRNMEGEAERKIPIFCIMYLITSEYQVIILNVTSFQCIDGEFHFEINKVRA